MNEEYEAAENGSYQRSNVDEENETKEAETQCPMHHHAGAPGVYGGPTHPHHGIASECPMMREYAKAVDMGPSVFCTIRDVLGLDPKYKPHRNVDAVRCAKLMSKMIKQKLCRRGMSLEGKLTWRFNDNQAYGLAVKILELEPENREFRFQ
jgi:hypothetical protein